MEKSPETSTELSILDKLDQNKNELILVDEWKQKLELLVSENPFVEIVDSKSYELAKQRKAVFRNARLELRNTGKTPSQESVLIGKINSIKDFVKSTIDDLVVIPSTPEDLQDVEVKRWEGIKEAEKAEKDRLENERIDAIKKKAVELEAESLGVIQKMTYSLIVSDSAKVSEIMETEFDFEEFDILYTNAFSRVQSALEEKVKDLTERENQRISKEKAEADAAAEKAKSDLQAKRLNELLPYNGYGSDVDMATLWNLTEEHYSKVLESKKSIKDSFDAEQKRIQEKEESDKKAQEEKVTQEKEAIFEIRSKRLIEIGMIYSDEHDTFWTKESENYILLASDVKDEDTIGFENLLSDSKKMIEESKQKASEVAAQKEADEKASKDDAAKLKAENKARIKRLASDKGLLIKSFSILKGSFVSEIVTLKFENTESQELANEMIKSFDSIFDDYMSKIENL